MWQVVDLHCGNPIKKSYLDLSKCLANISTREASNSNVSAHTGIYSVWLLSRGNKPLEKFR